MKNILLFFVLINSAFAFSQWSYVSTTPGASNINCISVVNQNLIWVCGDNNSLYMSTNGGVNWIAKNNGLPSGNFTSISALDSLSCWIGTEPGSIYMTSNGGLNWVMQFSLTGSFSDGIKMFNNNYGIYYGDPVGAGQPHQWRYTTNGGTNWLLSPNAPIANANEAGLLNAWDWIDSSRNWISTGNFTSGITAARTFRTTNGFISGNWLETNLTGSGNSQGLYFSAIAFVNNTDGMSACNGSGNAMRKTTDGGNTWVTVANPPGASNFIPFNMCGLKDGSNLIFAMLYTNTGLCYKTSDLGTTWIQETLPPQAAVYMRQAQFINSTLGFAGGGNGVFIRYGNSIGISLNNTETPTEFKLEQNYPNPFNPSTTINFSINTSSDVILKIFDISGKEVSTLINEFKNAGNYKIDFKADQNLNSGIYFYTLTSGENSLSKKFILIK